MDPSWETKEKNQDKQIHRGYVNNQEKKLPSFLITYGYGEGYIYAVM